MTSRSQWLGVQCVLNGYILNGKFMNRAKLHELRPNHSTP